MALMQITVIPLGTGSASVGEFVADIQKRLEEKNVNFQMNDMGTVIEGAAGDLLSLAAWIHELPFERGLNRVVTQIQLDDRRDKSIGIGDKTASVRARLESGWQDIESRR